MADTPRDLSFVASDLVATERWLATLPEDTQLMLCHDVFFPDEGARDSFKRDADRRPGAIKSYDDTFDDPEFPFWLTYMEPVPPTRAGVEALVSSMVTLADAYAGDYNGFKLLRMDTQGSADDALFDPSAAPRG